MPPSGLKPLSYDRRDYDFHKTFGSVAPVSFPAEYNADLGLWIPDQMTGTTVFGTAPMPQPTGCTNYTSCDICADDDEQLYNPDYLETLTQANARGGLSIRDSLSCVVKRDALRNIKGEWGPRRTAYFNIRPTYPLDFFDAIRLSLLSTKDEGRTVSAGTPFYPEWGKPVAGSGGNTKHVGKDGILPIPSTFDPSFASWHCWKVAGWKTINGSPYLMCKMWLGADYGDNGWVYMSREIANAIFNITGSCAFTATKLKGMEPQSIDFNFVKWVVSYIRHVFGLDKPASEPPIVVKPDEVVPVVPPPAPAPEPMSERIAQAAEAMLGTDPTPKDEVPDELACVSSLVAILPPELKVDRKLAYTPLLTKALKGNKNFKATLTPKRGTIVVANTVGTNHGHCLIMLSDTQGASNNSFGGARGKWTKNYTFDEFIRIFKKQKGLTIDMFDAVDTPVV